MNTMKTNKKNFQTNLQKVIARVMTLILLLVISLTLSSCPSPIPYDREVYSHEEFVKQIETYYSCHDLFVETYISFDLDDNDAVSKSIYFTATNVNSKARGFNIKHGYVCDRYNDDGLLFRFIYYLKTKENDYGYKIKCFNRIFDYNFNENDKIEILSSQVFNCKGNLDFKYDLMYEELACQLLIEPDAAIYNHTYHYSFCVNGLEMCCIHISSIEEASEEKLDEIIQMLLDSLVILNPDDFFIWRGVK